MTGLVPVIHDFVQSKKDVDGRDKHGHDAGRMVQIDRPAQDTRSKAYQTPAAYIWLMTEAGASAMNAPRVLLPVLLLCFISHPCCAQFFFFQNPVTLDNLDGNYRTIAACAYQHLLRRQGGLSRAEPRPGTIRLASASQQWELSFVNDDGGRQTRLDWSAGGYPSEFVLSTVRACAA